MTVSHWSDRAEISTETVLELLSYVSDIRGWCPDRPYVVESCDRLDAILTRLVVKS